MGRHKQHKKLKMFLSILLLLAIAGLVVWYLFYTPNKKLFAPSLNVEEKITSSQGKIAPQSIKEGDEKSAVLLDVEYPKIEELKNTDAQNKINGDLDTKVKEIVNNFRNEQIQSQKYSAGEQSSINLDFETIGLTGKIASFRLDGSEYYGGAPHPNNYVITLNYDLATGQKLALKNLFNPETKYLEAIASIANKKIAEQLAQDQSANSEWINEGASAKEENYQNFATDGSNLIIYFDPYQVAPYADGVIKVTIPFSDMPGFKSEIVK